MDFIIPNFTDDEIFCSKECYKKYRFNNWFDAMLETYSDKPIWINGRKYGFTDWSKYNKT